MTELIETGDEPEFNVTDLAWAEPVSGGAALRMCFANRKHGRMVSQYTVVVALVDLSRVLRACSKAASETDPFVGIADDALAH